MSTARLAEPCRTLPPPCPSPARLTNCDPVCPIRANVSSAATANGDATPYGQLRAPTSGWRRAGSDVSAADQSAMVYVARRQRRSAGTRGSDRRSQREPSAPAAMGTGIGDLRVSWPLADPKAELAPRARLPLRRAPADSSTTPPDRRKGAGPGARVGLIRPESAGFLQDTDTRQFLEALF